MFVLLGKDPERTHIHEFLTFNVQYTVQNLYYLNIFYVNKHTKIDDTINNKSETFSSIRAEEAEEERKAESNRWSVPVRFVSYQWRLRVICGAMFTWAVLLDPQQTQFDLSVYVITPRRAAPPQ